MSQGFASFRSFSIETPSGESNLNSSNKRSQAQLHLSYQRPTFSGKIDIKCDDPSRFSSQMKHNLFIEVIANNLDEVKKILDEGCHSSLHQIIDEQGRSLLHHAAQNDNEQIFSLLLSHQKRQSNPQLQWLKLHDQDGFGCIHYAALKGNLRIIEHYVQYGGQILDPSDKGLTCLHVAAQANHTKIIVYLWENRLIDIDHKDLRESTALHQACYFEQETSMEYLIAFGSNINQQDFFGHTPLHLAVMSGNARMVKKLLNRGANQNLANIQRETPLDTAKKISNQPILNHLQNNKSMNRCGSGERRNVKRYLIYLQLSLIINEILILIFICPYLEYTYYILPIAFWISYILSLICCCTDPGYIPTSDRSSLFELLQLHPCEEVCPYCKTYKPQRAKHCDICKRCVLMFDHHCPWIRNCVGQRNLGWFYFFVFSMILLISVTIWTSAQVIFFESEIYRFQQLINYLDIYLYYHKLKKYVQVYIMVEMIVFLLPMVALFIVQTRNILTDQTSFERITTNKRNKIQLSNCVKIFSC